MKPGVWNRLDVLARKMTPVLLTFLLVIFNVVPLYIPGLAKIAPWLPLMAIYYWSIYQFELMPAYAVFIIGLLHDILTGAPLGANTLIFLLVYGAVVSQHRFFAGKAFWVVWLGFSLVSGGALLLDWALMSAWNLAVIALEPKVYQYFLTLGAFPGLAWLFMRWQRAFLRQV